MLANAAHVNAEVDADVTRPDLAGVSHFEH
jgi:hypothetical protein